ncbi:NB-ARC domain-containing protein [Micromonospora sp. WMMD714]|uniref:NB-ARC domain-containing protein n=1 Tax=Micromonospora sp. WMMD714 TaxID=3016097 RepID=UPI00249C6360|nr:NB-ARC domain-containing protein [Micromonospora sp. WMMD714]WFE63678.1 NB-ARC domain-containing protein [Micromonospora sp. WMMD714]
MPFGASNALSGSVTGPSVQAGAIHGGVHFIAGAPERPPVPRQLPAPSPNFTNRSRELSELDHLLDQGGNVVALLCGPGGVGKSALARQWAHSRQTRFPDGQLYAGLGGFSDGQPLDPGTALVAFLRALGVAPERIPVDLAEQVTLYRTVTASRSLLVLLDDAFSAGQVRQLLPASTSTVVLVTSRRRLAGLIPEGARLLDVGPLPARQAVELLGRAVGRERILREPEPAEELARFCGGLPIALLVAAGRLASRPKLTVRRMAAELADEAQRLAGLSLEGEVSMRTIFDFSYRALTPEAAALYRRLVLHPGTEFGRDLVVAVAGPDQDPGTRVDAVVGELLEASLLEEVSEDRFRYHDLIQLHARELAERHDPQDSRRATVRTMLEFYLAAARRADLVVTPYRRRLPYVFERTLEGPPEFSDRAAALGWLERERRNLMAAGRVALDLGYHELAWQLSDVMWPLLLYVKNYRDRLEIDGRGVAAAQAWGNVWAEADMLKRLSRACSRVGEQEAAEQHGQAAVDRYRQAGDIQGVIDAEEGLATLYADTGREELAAEAYARVLTERRTLPDARSVGLSCLNLGMLQTRTGRPADALPLLAEARSIFAELTEVDPYNTARVLVALAGAHLGTGDLNAAEKSATEAALRMAELGADNERAEAVWLLGRIARQRGDAEAARLHLREAADVFTALDSPRLPDVLRQLDELVGDASEQRRVQDGAPAVQGSGDPAGVQQPGHGGEQPDRQ